MSAAAVANVLLRKDRREEFSATIDAFGFWLDEADGVVPKPCTDGSRLSAMMHSERGQIDDGIVGKNVI